MSEQQPSSPPPGWRLDELGCAGRENLYPAHVERYDAKEDAGAASEAEERIGAWCATGGEAIEGEWSRQELEEHVRDEHSTFTWLLEPMIARSGFEIAQAEHSEDGIFAKYLLCAV